MTPPLRAAFEAFCQSEEQAGTERGNLEWVERFWDAAYRAATERAANLLDESREQLIEFRRPDIDADPRSKQGRRADCLTSQIVALADLAAAIRGGA